VSATALKERLRADLKAAMQAKATVEVRLLRTLVAALDNAEAVRDERVPDKYVARSFGDPSGEIARRELDRDAISELLAAEVEARLAAAGDYERHGEAEEARRLRGEAELIARYQTG
jgi:uncharacterized protein YqeY